ncbi:MAG TPA: SMI1/KNR4 family protein [Vicinamibacteria bacterium]|jgi:hypothetical protein
MTMDEALATLERDRARHLTQRCSDKDLDLLEQALGRRLPADYRSLLARVGGGILYDDHELFGGRRLMVHDIELVPDVLTLTRQRADAGRPWPVHLVPLHRCQGRLHLLDVSGGAETRVVGEDGGSWPNLTEFLSQVVLPAARAGHGEP